MPHKISYCIVFVTILWGVYAENEDKVREVLQSNTTRTDYSNLLKAIIKLNEERFGVLKKLIRLEDYGLLNEVLRSGNTRNGKSDNLFLVVVTDNQLGPPRREMRTDLNRTLPIIILKKPQIFFRRSNVNRHNDFEIVFEHNRNIGNEERKKQMRFGIDDASQRFSIPINTDEEINDNSKPTAMRLEFTHKKINYEIHEDDYKDYYNMYHEIANSNPNINTEGKNNYKPDTGSSELKYSQRDKHQNNRRDKFDRPSENDHSIKISNSPILTSDRNGSEFPFFRDNSNDNDHSSDNSDNNPRVPESIPEENLRIITNDGNEYNEDNASLDIRPENGIKMKLGEEKPEERAKEILKSNPNVDESKAGAESRKTFQKCINKKALKMCSKSCIKAYRNVCRRFKCTSRSKRALKKECKRSCKETFPPSSKYSSDSDYSDSDY